MARIRRGGCARRGAENPRLSRRAPCERASDTSAEPPLTSPPGARALSLLCPSTQCFGLNKVRKKRQIEAALAARNAAVYADFLFPHLRADMIVLDLGCGQATISMGVAEVVPHGRVLGVDIDRAGLAAARGDAATIGCGNLAFAAADGRKLPFRSGVFDAVLCHSMLETLNDPTSVVTEVRRVMKRGGIVGAASVEYGGVIFCGAG